jgi:predicted site-specific integrase-resolvase
MKKQLNEIKKMQKIAGIIKNKHINELYSDPSGKDTLYERISDQFSDLIEQIETEFNYNESKSLWTVANKEIGNLVDVLVEAIRPSETIYPWID